MKCTCNVRERERTELSREWQKESVVVQLDVNRAFDHVPLIAVVRSWKLHESALGHGTVEQSKAPGCTRVSRHLHNDYGAGLERLDQELESSETWQGIWTTSCCPAICYADDVVLAAASVAAAEVIVAEVIAKLKEVGLTVGAEKIHCTSHPMMMDM